MQKTVFCVLVWVATSKYSNTFWNQLKVDHEFVAGRYLDEGKFLDWSEKPLIVMTKRFVVFMCL